MGDKLKPNSIHQSMEEKNQLDLINLEQKIK